MFPQRQPPRRTTFSGEGILMSWLSAMVMREAYKRDVRLGIVGLTGGKVEERSLKIEK